MRGWVEDVNAEFCFTVQDEHVKESLRIFVIGGTVLWRLNQIAKFSILLLVVVSIRDIDEANWHKMEGQLAIVRYKDRPPPTFCRFLHFFS